MTRLQLVLVMLVTSIAATTFAEVATPQPQPPRAPPRGAGAPMSDELLLRDPGPRLPSRPPPPPMILPATEIVTQGKQLAGTWQCKGVTLRGDGSSKPLIATLTSKLDLDNAWIQSTLVEKAGTKSTEYRTFDGIAKQWTRIQLVNTSGHAISTSLGEQDGKWTWLGSAQSPSGTLQTRDFEERTAAGTKRWGEAMLGGAWQKLYEVTCRK